MQKSLFAKWRSYFLTGLAVLLPGVATILVVFWFFSSVANVTDLLLFFLPSHMTHQKAGEGPMYWYWSLAALALAVFLITLTGRLTRYYLGKKIVELLDRALLHVPLLNKIYLTIKQVNDAFTSNKSSFKQVVLVEFPRPGMRAVGFVTGELDESLRRDNEKILNVFIPTTPNPTSGFLVLARESEVTKLDMSVAEGIKFIVSLGSIPPDGSSMPRLPNSPSLVADKIHPRMDSTTPKSE